MRTRLLNLIKLLNFILTYFCYTTNVKLNKGAWNGDKRLKHGQFSSDNEEFKKAHNTVYVIITPIRALRFID
ncbi:hypothetical protein DDV96_13695 [Marixanthomonas spongiae]|uniref:Uncharacterized protein n=1 Tax=Marixanthomonas spongiae TaxID=2174845 RepID=A0A2U0HX12_9FLAO|nr:hypothetical protein DDV96_13695 [Marixanthomonas spongiae]